MTSETLMGNTDAGNPHVRFDDNAASPARGADPGRGTLLRAARLAVGVAAATWAAVSFGTAKELTVGTHNWNDADGWSPAGVPVAGDGITISESYAQGAKTLLLTNDVTTAVKSLAFKAGSNTYRARFAGTNCVFAPAAPAEAVTYPQLIRGYNDDRLFNFSGNSSQAPFTYSDFDFDVGHEADGADTLNFYRGAFNYWDPDGTPTTRTIALFVGDHGTALTDHAMRVTLNPGVTFKGPAVTMSGAADATTDNAGDKALVFNGATASLASITCQTKWPRPHNVDIVVTNKAFLTVGGITAQQTSDAYGVDGDPLRYRLLLEDSTLWATNAAVYYASHHSHVGYDVIMNRAKFVSTRTSGAALSVDMVGSSPVGNVLNVRDSVIVASNASISVGSTSGSAVAKKNALAVSFDKTRIDAKGLTLRLQTSAIGFTNCVINLLGGTLSHRLDLASGMKTAYFKDTVVTNATLAGDYYSGGSSRLVFDGGKQTFKWNNYTPENAELCITNGADFTVTDSMQYWGFDPSTDVACTQVINVAKGGKLTAKDVLGVGFNKNNSKTYTGVHVGEGATLSVGNSCWCGFLGNGHIRVDGGTMTGEDFWLAAGAADACTIRGISDMYVRNGSVTFRNYVKIGNGTGVGHDARLILDEGGVFRSKSSITGYYVPGSSVAEIWSDGGTISDTVPTGMSGIFCGPKGLTFDPIGNSRTFYQACTNRPGTAGLFRVAGTNGGSVTLVPSTWFVANTAVDALTLVITSSFVSDTALAATNGATLKITSNATPTVGSLTVKDSTLVIDPGSQLTVTGAANFENVTFKITTNPTKATTNDVIVVGGEISEASARALARASMANTFPSGTFGTLLPVYDESTGKTTVKFMVTPRVAPLTDETVWQGATGDLWNDAAGWTAGKPDGTKEAVFPASETTAKDVAVPKGATVGAIGFTGDGYTLAGETLTMPTLPGAALIESDAAAITNTIAADVWVQNGFDFDVGAGSRLAVSGDIDASNFRKAGKGELVLTGANAIGDRVTVAGGRTVADSAAALGAAVNDRATVAIERDTLQINSGDGSETVIDAPFQLAVTNRRTWVVLDCKTPVTITDWKASATGGGLIKRGQGKLTIKVKNGQNLSVERARMYNTNGSDTQFTLKADGSGLETTTAATTVNYGGEISAFEGETVIAPADGETGVPKVKMSAGALALGLKCKQGSGMPTLTLDGVDFTQPSDIFRNNLNSQGYATRSCLKIINGGRFHSTQTAIADGVWDGGRHAYVVMTNGTLSSGSQLLMTYCNVAASAVNGTTWAEYYTKDSALLSGGSYMGWGVNYGIAFIFDCGLKGYFDNTFLGGIDRTKYASLYLDRGAFGEMVFSNGSVFQVNNINTTTWVPVHSQWYTANFKLAFDDATWNYGTGDYTLASTIVAAESQSHFQIEMRGAGVRLAPAAGTTFTTEYPFTGTGGLIVDGPGTVKFAANTLQFTGSALVRQGTLDAGGQSVKVKLEPGDSAPTLKDCAPEGDVIVDMDGVECKKGDVITVARLSGTTPIATPFKAVNFTNPTLRGNFTVQDGEVKMTVASKRGLTIVFW